MIQPVTNSTTAFQVQNAAGTSTVLDVDTASQRVGIGTAAPAAALTINSTGATNTNGIRLLGAAGQSLNIYEDNNTSRIDSSGGTLSLNYSSGQTVKVGGAAASSFAFEIQDANSSDILNVDTATTSGSRNGIVSVGSNDANATLFVLDTKNTAGDPTGQNGAMYYNSSTNTFRCYQNSVWGNCGGGVSSLQGAYDGGSTIAIPNGGNSIQISAPSGQEGIQLSTTAGGNTPFLDFYNVTQAFGIRSDDNALHIGAWDPTYSTFYSDDFSLGTNGAVTLQNSTDSANAFTIQNAASNVIQNTVFAADTQNSRINISGDTNIGNFGNRLFSDNFESGNFSLWNSGSTGSISVGSSVVHDGKYAAAINVSGTGGAYTYEHIANSNTVYLRAWVYISSQSAGNNASLLNMEDSTGSTTYWSVYRDSSGALHLVNNGAGVATGGTLPTGSWHLLEMQTTIGAGTGTNTVWLDGTQVISAASQSNGTNPVGGIWIGQGSGGAATTWSGYIDDVSADTQPTGVASSLSVGDSLHVGGTSTFGGSLSVQNAGGSQIFGIDANSYNNYLGGSGNINIATGAALNFGNNIVLGQDTGASGTFHIDSYNTGGVSISNGSNSGAGSTTAFQVQKAGGGTVLNVDNQNSTVTVTAGKDTATLGTSLFTGSLSGAGWTPSGTGSGASATHTTGTTAVGPSPAVAIGSGNNYYVAWTINNANAGSTLTLTMGGQTLATYSFDSVSAGGSIADSASILTSSTANLQITPSSNFTGSISGITVQLQGLNWTPGLVVNNTSNSPSLEVRASSDQGSLFMGYESGLQNSTGTNNTAVGSWALQQNVTGSDNVALGTGALENNISGDANVAIGRNALINNTSGTDNVAIGRWALTANVQGSGNIAIGSSALDQATLSYDNIAIGQYALNNVTSNYGLVAIGSGAGSSITTGGGNTAVGYASLYYVTTGYNNSAFGQYALQHTTGNENAAFGTLAMRYNTTGSQNTAFGTYSLQNNTTGSRNVALGYNAGGQLTTSTDNTLLGDAAGYLLTTGSNNIIIGSGVNAVNAAGNSQLNIGNVIYGDLGGGQIGIGTSTFSPGFALTVNDGVQAGSETDVSNNGIFSWGASGLTTSIQGSANGVSSYMQFKVNNNVALSFGQQGAATFTTYSPASNAFQIQTSGGASMLNVDTTGNGTVSIGAVGTATNASTVHIADQTNGSGNQIVSIGSTNGSSTLLLQGGSPGAGDGVTIVSGTGSISIGTNSTAHTVNIGTTTGAGAVVLQAGTGGISLTAATTGTITLGGTSQTGAISIGQSTASQTINLGNVAPGTGNTNTIKIGATASTTSGTTAITIGGTSTSTNGATSVTILAGNHSGSTVASGSRTSSDTNSTGIKVSLGDRTATSAVCSTLTPSTGVPTSGTGYELVDCSGTPVADYAEQYPVASGTQVGDVVATGTQMVNTYDTTDGNIDWTKVKGQITQLVKSNQSYQPNAIGIVSDNNGDFSSTGYNIKQADNPMSVALNGRVPVNVTNENGDIQPGDYLTTSATHPGYAMKATQSGYVIGQALASYSSSDPGQVMVFVKNFYWPGPTNNQYLQNGGDASFASLSVNGNTTLANLDVSGDTTLSSLNVSGPSTLASLSVTGDANIGGNLTVTGSATIANLTVTGSAQFAGNITIGGHVITAGGQPTAQGQGAIGTGASVAVDGTDTTGTITITTGSSPTAGDLAKILFSKTYGQAPHIVLSPSNNNAAGLRFYKGATSATDFMFDTTDTPQANTTYTFDYFIAQ